MKKRSTGIVLALAVVAVLSMGLAASASAAPSLTSVSPTGGSSATVGSYQITIYGQNLTDFIGTPDVNLEQQSWPYDEIPSSGVVVVPMLGGDYISCYINTYGESAGSYDVVVSGYWLIGQMWPDDLTLAGAFSVTGTPPVTTTPAIASIRPESAMAGGPAFTLTVNGSNFATGLVNPAVVYWNGTPLTTTPGGLPNPTAVCTAAVPAALIASPGVAAIKVVNPLLGGGATSNQVYFSINAVVPTLTGLNPTSTWARYINPPQVTLTGTTFQSTAQVLVNGVVHAATYVSATQMTVQLTAADIANPGTLNFAVRNTVSGTQTSTQPFTLTSDTTTPVTSITGADTAWHNQPVTLAVTVTDTGGPGVQKTYYGIGIPPSIQMLSLIHI